MKIGDIEISNRKLSDVPVHQSAIELALGCNRKYYFKNIMGVQLRGKKRGDSSVIGDIYHEYHKRGDEEQTEIQVTNYVQDRQLKLQIRIDAGEDIDGELWNECKHLQTAHDKARVMARLFWDKYPPNPNLKIVGKEIPIKMWTQIAGGRYLEGTLDQILEDKAPTPPIGAYLGKRVFLLILF